MIGHDLTVYENDPYGKENLLSMSNYVGFIKKYADNKGQFLELGIGHSKTIELLTKSFEDVTVLDGEQSLVDKYKLLYPKVEFIKTYFEDFESQQLYQNIGMGFILEHVNNPSVILKKYSRFLDEKGKLFVSVPNAASLHRLIAYEAGLLKDISLLSETDKRYGHLRFFTYSQWEDLFKKNGFKVEASHGLFLKSFTTVQIDLLKLDNNIYTALGKVAAGYPEISNSTFFILRKEN